MPYHSSEKHTSELQSPCNFVCRIIRSEEHTSELQSPCNLVCRIIDRKNTRLNSSHLVISYAVFCLKKKNNYSEVVRDITKYYNCYQRRCAVVYPAGVVYSSVERYVRT